MLWHDGLKAKLKKKLGIAGEIYTYKLISNFLAGRTIQVRVGNQYSKVIEIKNGTSQGSVISPILFNDLGPQNPTPTSKSVRAGNRLTRVSQLHYIPRYRIQLERQSDG